MADGIYEYTVTKRQKNPSEELIVSWIAGARTDISEEMIESSFSKCIQNMVNHFFCFLLLFFSFFFFKVQSKIFYTGKHGSVTQQ